MSEIKVDKISKRDGSKGVGADYVIDGSAKAWANLNGTGTIALLNSLNISSLVDNGTGDYTTNFTNAFAADEYIFNYTGLSNSNGAIASGTNLSKLTTSLRFTRRESDTNVISDTPTDQLLFLGDLAQ
ncbi:hypothetical protein [Curvivirga aplysinae]|uniref:hypothetical protein n=1 Tax=Curvivirga aplysinae TaxID=2529852 RepID=UPI0012BCFC01|nr:hypothetical protein [Curvivirga aplysinae]MTI10182.1 hypothetical protein [Curvivirga aplysinae]